MRPLRRAYNAGIQTGLGPFMAIYYTTVRHCNPGQVGVLIARRSVAGIAGLTVAFGAVGILMLPGYMMQIAAWIVSGLAVTTFPAAPRRLLSVW